MPTPWLQTSIGARAAALGCALALAAATGGWLAARWIGAWIDVADGAPTVADGLRMGLVVPVVALTGRAAAACALALWEDRAQPLLDRRAVWIWGTSSLVILVGIAAQGDLAGVLALVVGVAVLLLGAWLSPERRAS